MHCTAVHRCARAREAYPYICTGLKYLAISRSKPMKMAGRKGNADNPDFDVELAELLNQCIEESEPKQRKALPTAAADIEQPRSDFASNGIDLSDDKTGSEQSLHAPEKAPTVTLVMEEEDEASTVTDKDMTATNDATVPTKQQGNTPEEVESTLDETSVTTTQVTLQQVRLLLQMCPIV